MTTFCELKQKPLKKWLKGRPQIIQDNVKKYPPNELFRLKETSQICSIISYAEDGTVRIFVDVRYNCFPHNMFNREVFGVNPSSLDSIDTPLDQLGDGFLIAANSH